MTITSTQVQSKRQVNKAYGRYLDSAGSPAAAALQPGFVATKVLWLNLTDRIRYEWFDGMAAGTTIKTAANGTVTLDTADVAIGVSSVTGVVTIGAAAIIQNKQYQYEIVE